MAEKKILNKYGTRYGLILRSDVAGKKLEGFELPPLDSRFKLISANDLKTNTDEGKKNRNSISMFGGSMPIFAEDLISYVGQPLLALFGPDYESVELMLKEIKVKTSPLNENELQARIKEDHKGQALEYAWGQTVPKDLSIYRRVESEFTYHHSVYYSPMRYTISAWADGKDLHIETPMQWPELIKRSVEKSALWNRKNIQLHEKPYYAPHDEYLMMPALYAVVATLGVLALDTSVELRAVGESARAGVKVRRISWIKDPKPEEEDINPKIIAEQVDMTVDQGAYTFASEEYQKQAMTGLLPLYSVDRFIAKIHINRSFSHPASFSGSLGYSEALASSEYHASRLVDSKVMTPHQLRLLIDKGKTKFTSYAPSVSILEAKKNTSHIFDASVYNRKWISNSLQHGDFGLVGYLRGIGMAEGMGIAGFSSKTSLDSHFTSVMTYTTRKNVTLNSSAPRDESWKETISDVFNKNEKKRGKTTESENLSVLRSKDSVGVILQDLNQETADSGPDVLSRFQCCYPVQLKKACLELKEAIKDNTLPVSVKFRAEGSSETSEFNYSGYGSVIVEVLVNKEDYQPKVTELWASFCFSKLPQNTPIKQATKRSILSTLKECGAIIPPEFKMHIDYTISKTLDDSIASIPSIASGLTMAAFSNALYQIGDTKGASLPTSAKKLEEVTKNGVRI